MILDVLGSVTYPLFELWEAMPIFPGCLISVSVAGEADCLAPWFIEHCLSPDPQSEQDPIAGLGSKSICNAGAVEDLRQGTKIYPSRSLGLSGWAKGM